MGLEYFTCADCGDETNDSAPAFTYWPCAGCDFTLCDGCARGRWRTCRCSGAEYCEACVAAGRGCECGEFLDCALCLEPELARDGLHNPGCAVRAFKGLFTLPPAGPRL